MGKFIKKFPKIDKGQLLSDEQLNSIEGGACDGGCKKQCITNMNGSVGGSGTSETVKEVAKTVKEIAS
ncbi:hypothetical protein FACS189413_10140 [Bacteroidia bacterium]|nr:hypothetical protein FACS189413_10140 [Bacteroidia bacterium]